MAIGLNGQSDRGADGRFARGNRASVGRPRPLAAQVAALRSALLGATTPKDIQEIAERLIADAKKGSIPAATLLWRYCLGEPAPEDFLQRLEEMEAALGTGSEL